MGPVARETRETIARLRNCIVALAQEKVLLFDTTIQYTYDASLKYQVLKKNIHKVTLCNDSVNVYVCVRGALILLCHGIFF